MEKKIKISTYIKEMMKNADLPIDGAAECIGVSVGTFRNKLTQDRFSVDDLIILSELCNYHLALVPNNLKEPLETLCQDNQPHLLVVDSFISDETQRLKVKVYKEKKLDKNIELLKSYIKNMSPSEKQAFSQMKLPLNLNGKYAQIAITFDEDVLNPNSEK